MGIGRSWRRRAGRSRDRPRSVTPQTPHSLASRAHQAEVDLPSAGTRTTCRAQKTRVETRDQVFSSSSLDLPGLDGHDGECPRSNGPDTCFVNIVWRHRTPWFISGWRRRNHIVGWSAGEWGLSTIARLATLLPGCREVS
jgi:hypothetical protein